MTLKSENSRIILINVQRSSPNQETKNRCNSEFFGQSCVTFISKYTIIPFSMKNTQGTKHHVLRLMVENFTLVALLEHERVTKYLL